MTTRVPLSTKQHAKIISAYAPTMTNTDETKDGFYEERNLLKSVPNQNNMLLVSDFNARVGSNNKT